MLLYFVLPFAVHIFKSSILLFTLSNNTLLTDLCFRLQLSGIPLDMFSRTAHGAYTQEMRDFALTLQLYGPKAYDFAATRFPLPHRNTLRK